MPGYLIVQAMLLKNYYSIKKRKEQNKILNEIKQKLFCFVKFKLLVFFPLSEDDHILSMLKRHTIKELLS